MKRIIVLFFAIISIVSAIGCTNTKKNETDAIDFQSGIYSNKNWDVKDAGTYEKAVVPDKETAIKIAEAIFDGMEKSKSAERYVPQTIFYDEQDEIWIVSFWEDRPENIAGADCSIAIRKADGKVMIIQFGE